MNWMPLVERELRLAGRRPRTYRIRALTALAVIVVSLGMLYLGFGRLLSPGSAGRSLFIILSLLASAYVLFDGVLMTADSLSQEKREGTMGLLFLAGLRSHEIVWAKLISRTANSAYCLFAALPALGIGLFLGGVTGLDFFRMTVALMNGLFFSACFGLLISATSRKEGQALSRALLGIVTLALAVPALGWSWSLYRQSGVVPSAYLLVSPAGALLEALGADLQGPTPRFSFVQVLLAAHLLGWCFFAGAAWCLGSSWRDPSGANVPRCPAAPKATREKRRRRLLESNPVIWVGGRRSAGDFGSWSFLVVIAVTWAIAWACVRNQWLTLPVYSLVTALLHLSLMSLVLLRACRGPAEDQRNGVLEILLTTPLGHDVYLEGRLLSIKRHTLAPLTFIITADLGLLAAGLWEIGALNWEWLAWIGVFTALLLKLLADLYALSWVGLWQGLKTANTGRAVRTTIFYVLLLRWIVLLGLLALIGVVTQGQIFQSPAGGIIATVGYLILLIMTLLHFCAAARSELQDNLRALAFGADRPVEA